MQTLTITQAALPTIELLETSHKASKSVLDKVAAHMDAVEKLQCGTLTGEQKRKEVIEFAKKEIIEVVKNLDYWLPLIIKFINTAKAAFNAWKDFIKSL